MNNPVSIVIPSFNRAGILSKTLKMAAESNPIEILIVDDCSDDLTEYRRIVHNVATLYPEVSIRIIRNNRNSGASESRKIGLSYVTSDHVLFMDDDIVLTPDYLEIALKGFDYGSDVSVVTGNTITVPTAPSMKGHNTIQKCDRKRGLPVFQRTHSRITGRLSYEIIKKIDTDAFVLFGWNPLLWKRQHLLDLGIEFHEYKGNGYREETDPQIQIWKGGKKVLFKKDLCAFHIGSRNDGGQWGTGKLKTLRWYLSAIINNKIFLKRHGVYLKENGHLTPPLSLANLIFAVRISSIFRKS